ncbi:hypothetical protein [Pseudomonas sp. RL_15y_Pfl2_60]|uniref:hypothetical protein n=1 Tax=Pseudomonas sp. RL_15y_Pfl2_60 TaxID=3088709 RepID=UPI0030D89AAE
MTANQSLWLSDAAGSDALAVLRVRASTQVAAAWRSICGAVDWVKALQGARPQGVRFQLG